MLWEKLWKVTTWPIHHRKSKNKWAGDRLGAQLGIYQLVPQFELLGCFVFAIRNVARSSAGATLAVQSLRLSSLSRPPHVALGTTTCEANRIASFPKQQHIWKSTWITPATTATTDLSVCQAALVLLHLLQKLRVIHAFQPPPAPGTCNQVRGELHIPGTLLHRLVHPKKNVSGWCRGCLCLSGGIPPVPRDLRWICSSPVFLKAFCKATLHTLEAAHVPRESWDPARIYWTKSYEICDRLHICKPGQLGFTLCIRF